MSFFGEEGDPFEDIFREFFGTSAGRPRTSSRSSVVSSESEERVIDYIEEEKNIYFVFELPGFDKKDIDINVKGNNLIINVVKKNASSLKGYVKEKLSKEIEFQKNIPVKVDKKFISNFNNGILEVQFKRK